MKRGFEENQQANEHWNQVNKDVYAAHVAAGNLPAGIDVDGFPFEAALLFLATRHGEERMTLKGFRWT